MCESLMSDLQGPAHNVPALAQPLVYFPLPEVASYKGDPLWNRMFGGQASDVYTPPSGPADPYLPALHQGAQQPSLQIAITGTAVGVACPDPAYSSNTSKTQAQRHRCYECSFAHARKVSERRPWLRPEA